jgi:hypothetical protein
MTAPHKPIVPLAALLWALVAPAAHAAGPAGAKPVGQQPKPPPAEALPIALLVQTPAPTFRDVSLEKRCEALGEFIRSFATAHLDGSRYVETGCGEGNGLGGARYSLEFRYGPAGAAHPYRLDASFGEDGRAEVRLCDTANVPFSCTANPPAQPLRFARNAGAKSPAEPDPDALAALTALHPNLRNLLPTAAGWIGAKSLALRIFGVDYVEYAKRFQNTLQTLPINDHGGTVKLRLTPDATKGAAASFAGSVAFEDVVADDFLSCLHCLDAKCLEGRVRYRFVDRFLSLAVMPAAGAATPAPATPAPSGDGAAYAAGWILETDTPIGASSPGWTFVCGVTRYSLQRVKL